MPYRYHGEHSDDASGWRVVCLLAAGGTMALGLASAAAEVPTAVAVDNFDESWIQAFLLQYLTYALPLAIGLAAIIVCSVSLSRPWIAEIALALVWVAVVAMAAETVLVIVGIVGSNTPKTGLDLLFPGAFLMASVAAIAAVIVIRHSRFATGPKSTQTLGGADR